MIEKKIRKIVSSLIIGVIGYFITKLSLFITFFIIILIPFVNYSQTFNFIYFISTVVISIVVLLFELYPFLKKIKYRYFFTSYIEKQFPEIGGALSAIKDERLKNSDNISKQFLIETEKKAENLLNNISIWSIKPIFSYKKLIPFMILTGFIWVGLLFPLNNRFKTIFFKPISKKQNIIKIVPIFNYKASIVPPKYLSKKSKELINFDGFLKAYTGSKVRLTGVIKESVDSCELIFASRKYGCKIKDNQFLIDHTILQNGSYHIVFKSSKGDIYQSNNFLMEIIPDIPPEIKIVFPDNNLIINYGDEVEVTIQASDDIKIDKIVWNYSIKDGESGKQELNIVKSKNITKKFNIDFSKFDRGDIISYHFEAYDNDTALGPKIASTRVLKIEILSPMKIHEDLLERLNKVAKGLTKGLANHLEIDIKLPIGKILSLKKSYNKNIYSNISLLDKFIDIDDPLMAKGSILSLKKVIFDLKNGLNKDKKWREKYSTPLIKDLENSILYIIDIIDREKLEIINELYKELKEEKNNLKTLITKYKENKDPNLKKDILKNIKKIKRKIARVMKKLSELSKDIESKFINEEASKVKQMSKNINSLEDLLNSGNFDEMLQILDQLESELDQMMDNISDKKDGLMSKRDQETQKKISKFMNELQDLIYEEEQLLKESKKISNKIMDHLKKNLDKNGDFFKDNLALLESGYNDVFNSDDTKLDQYDLSVLQNLLDDILLSINGLKSKDIVSTLNIIKNSFLKYDVLKSTYQQFIKWGSRSHKKMAKNNLELTLSSFKKLKKVEKNIEKLLNKLSNKFDEKDKEKMDKLSKYQQSLKKKIEQLKAMGKDPLVPLPKDSSDSFKQVENDMKKSSDNLSAYQPKQAQLSQKKVVETLKQINKNFQKQRSANNMRSGSQKRRSHKRVEISDKNDKGPRELREDIMKAMKKNAPKGYEDVVKSYFENIIK